MQITILLLGATGRTSKLILNELLKRGHAVHVIVRDASKIKVSSDWLQVFEGSTLDQSLLEKAVDGCQAVISALNISRKNDFPWSRLRTPKTLMSDTIKKTIPILTSRNIKRIIVISAWGANETLKYIPWWFRWLIRHSNINYGYLDHERQEKLLINTDLDWTAVRPTALVNMKANKLIQVSLNNNPRPSLIISRNAVARFTVDILEQAELIRLSLLYRCKTNPHGL